MADPSVLNKRYLAGVMSITTTLQTLGVAVDLPSHRDPYVRQVMTIETIAKALATLVARPADAVIVTISDEMTIAELKEFAGTNGIDLEGARTKHEIVGIINASLPE